LKETDSTQTLEALIDQDINNIDAFLVYADWLQQQGDPRGEFILLCDQAEQQQSPAITTARDQRLKDRGKQLLGDLYEPYQQGRIELIWRLGFVDHLRIIPGLDAQAILDGLPTQPCCRYLRSLDLSHSGIFRLPVRLGELRQVRQIDVRACALERATIMPPWQHLNRVWASAPPPPATFQQSQGQTRSLAEEPIWLLAGYFQTTVEGIGGGQFQAILEDIELHETHEGRRLVNLNEWSPAFCAALASEDRLELSYRHWLVIAFLRIYYGDYHVTPAVRVLTQFLGKSLGEESADQKALYELFIHGPIRQAPRYAGLPTSNPPPS